MAQRPNSRTPLEVVKAVLAASAARNVEDYIANYHVNAVMRLRDGSVISGKDGIHQRFLAFAESGVTRDVALHEDLTVYGDGVALVCTRWTIRLDDGKTVDEFHGSAHDVLVENEEDGWLISIDHPFEEWASSEPSTIAHSG